MTENQNTDTDPLKSGHSPRCVEMGWWLLHELGDGESCDTATYTPPATWHPGRCYCSKFGPGHAPGLIGLGGLASSCNGDTDVEHDALTCPACLAGATDYRPTIETGQTWVSRKHGTDHEVSGPGGAPGTWEMWGPVGNLYVTTTEDLYARYTLDLDR